MSSEPTVKLSLACGMYDQTEALASGDIQIPGVDLQFITIHNPKEMFDRMILGHEFDVSEMSVSEYICRFAAGERDLVALPVFPARCFRHDCIVVNSHLVKKPSDLNGKSIGVQGWTMTAAVWIRELLQSEGVDLSTIRWVEGALEHPGSHGAPSTRTLFRNVDRIANPYPDKSLSQCLQDGDIAATIGAAPPACLNSVDHINYLFPDPRVAATEYYRRTGIFPIMHNIVVRREIMEKHHSAVGRLYKALLASREAALTRLRNVSTYRCMLPFLPLDLLEAERLFGDDYWPYGLDANRKTLSTLVDLLFDQGMIEHKVEIDELFAPETL